MVSLGFSGNTKLFWVVKAVEGPISVSSCVATRIAEGIKSCSES